MKGIILAGGQGTRLLPLTKIINKALMPVYNKPMIYYPMETLAAVGIKDIIIVSGRGHAGQFLELLGSGKNFGVRLSYAVQEEAGGIAQALGLCRDFADKEKIIVALADNIFENLSEIKKAVKDFAKQKRGAKLMLKAVSDPERFGVAYLSGEKIEKIIEKPKDPKSNLAVVGLYMYDHNVWDIIKGLRPSNRGELEITDVNNHYVKQGLTTYEILKGWWVDAGTFDSLAKATNLMLGKSNNR